MRHVAHALLVGVEAKQAGDQPLLVGDDRPVSGAISNPVLYTLSPDRPLLVGDDRPVSGAISNPVLYTLSPDRPLLVGDDRPVSSAVPSFEQGSNT